MTSQNSQNAGAATLEALQFSGSGTGTTMVAGRLLSGEKERWGGVSRNGTKSVGLSPDFPGVQGGRSEGCIVEPNRKPRRSKLAR